MDKVPPALLSLPPTMAAFSPPASLSSPPVTTERSPVEKRSVAPPPVLTASLASHIIPVPPEIVQPEHIFISFDRHTEFSSPPVITESSALLAMKLPSPPEIVHSADLEPLISLKSPPEIVENFEKTELELPPAMTA